jgi:beta-aspartyl-dipeptidase (metallo-type)
VRRGVGGQIVGLVDDKTAEAIEGLHAGMSTTTIDAKGCVVVPGFVDIHVHITGGGGELGPASRPPAGRVQEMIEGGMTTVVGVLGTDCVSRSLENLVV